MSVIPFVVARLPVPLPTVRFRCEAWWTCSSTARHTWRSRSDCMLATGAAYSVLPRFIRDRLNLVITPVPGVKGLAPTWCGVPCTFGRITLWLPADDAPSGHRDFSLLSLLPRDDVVDMPPFAFLGAQFLMEYGAKTILDCGVGGSSASIVIP